MENYEQKFKIGDIVKGIRTFNGEIIEGKFNGFCLHNKLNPNSVVGVIITNDGSYDVSPDSIEFVESEDEKIRKAIIEYLNSKYEDPNAIRHDYAKWIAWLEKQGDKKSLSTEETELNSLAFLTELGYTCIPPKKEQQPEGWSKEDEEIHQKASDIAKEAVERGFDGTIAYYAARDMAKWFKSLKPRWRPTEDKICG